MAEKKIGEVTHYFDKIGVAIIKLSAPLRMGDKIRVKGATSDFEQVVDSMQIDHQDVESAESGQELGIKVSDKAREGDDILKVE
jgi:putative protease